MVKGVREKCGVGHSVGRVVCTVGSTSPVSLQTSGQLEEGERAPLGELSSTGQLPIHLQLCAVAKVKLKF